MQIRIIENKIAVSDLIEIAKDGFGDMVKAVVDIDKQIMAIGGELHADEEAALLEKGSKQENLWGINIYPEKDKLDWLKYDSMINIRPTQDNQSRDVENEQVREKIKQVIEKVVK